MNKQDKNQKFSYKVLTNYSKNHLKLRVSEGVFTEWE
jgi:hypothetical protein